VRQRFSFYQKRTEHQQTNDHSGQANLIFPYGSAPELAKVLNVDTKTLYCTRVIVPLTPCTAEEFTYCSLDALLHRRGVYPALLRNRQRVHSAGPRCAVHRQDWFPIPGKRGSLLGSCLCPASRIVTMNHGTLVLRLSTKVTSLGKKAFGAPTQDL
jgi:hypothetical protein